MSPESIPFFTGYQKEHRWQELTVPPELSLRETIRRIDEGASQILLVVDGERHLLGTVTDGDIRRGILKGLELSAPCSEVMNTAPTTFREGTPRSDILKAMRSRVLQHIPIVNEDRKIVDLVTLNDLLSKMRLENPVVIMAGGFGKRLGDLTKDTPKPMLKVGGRPILETILKNFIEQGFYKFYFSVNYLSDQIKSYFQDGSAWNVNIEYIEEDEPLGTAGALHLMDAPTEQPMVVMNGDLLTKINFQYLLKFHKESKSCATMCVREFDYQIPYGVVHVDEHRLRKIVEKPTQKFFVNAGIYVLGKEALQVVPKGEFYNMTTLFEKLMAKDMAASTFPIHEYWKDIGQLPDYQSADVEYSEVFESCT